MSTPKSSRPNPPASPGKTASLASPATPEEVENHSPGRLYRGADWITFAVTTLVVFLGYLLTLSPDLTLEDSGELAVGSMYAGVPHPPGYPLWTLYTWLFTKLIPFSNIAFRVSISSAVAASLSAGIVGLLISRGSSMILEGIDWFKDLNRKLVSPICLVSGLAGGMLLGFNGYIWSQAVIVEVYTLAVLTLMGVFAFLLRWMYAPGQLRYLYLSFFFFGLCLCNHQTLIVAAMGLEIAILAADRRLGRDMFWANGFVFTYVVLGRAFGFSGVLADNPGVFLIFSLIGYGSLVTVFAVNGKMDSNVRLYTTYALAGVGLIAILLFQRSSALVAEFNIQAGQAVAAGQSPESLIRQRDAAEVGAHTLLVLLSGLSFLLFVSQFAISYSTEQRDRLLSRFVPTAICGLCFIAGALFYLYMPLASMSNPPMNWGYPRTWDGFIHAFTRGQYEKTNPSLELGRLGRQLLMYAQGCQEEFNWANLLVGLVPFVFLFQMRRRERAWLIGLTGIYLCLALILLMLLNPGVDLQSRKLVKVFFTSSHVVIALAVGYGLSLICAMLLTRFQETRTWLLAGAAVALLFNVVEAYNTWQENHQWTTRLGPLVSIGISLVFMVILTFSKEKIHLGTILALFALIPVDSMLSHWADNEQRGHLFGYWFGHDMFKPPFQSKDQKPLYPEMARDAVLYGGTDPGRFCPTYMIFCESFIPPNCRRDPDFDRRDVVLITQNALADNTYLDYIRAHYNRSAQIDPLFFQGMLNDTKSMERGRTNTLARLAAPLDHFFTDLGAKIEKQRRAGSSFFTSSDFTDLNAFKSRIKAGADPLSAYLRGEIGAAVDGDAGAVATALNRLLEGPSLYDEGPARPDRTVGSLTDKPSLLPPPARFAKVELDDRLQQFAAQNPPTPNRVRLNRLLLEAAYPKLIAPSQGGLYPDREIITASPEDMKRCFDEYTADAARRYQLGQLDQGEQVVQLPDGRVSVSGQVAVMAINGLLTKVMFDKNPNHEFYVEESFPLKWMYPHLVPYGIIMKIERQPVAELDEATIARDHEFWTQYSGRFIGSWITYDTPISEVCDFAMKTYLERDLSSFKGDPKFIRDYNAQKAFSKLRNAQGKSIYAWRAERATNPALQQRYLREAEFALKQAFAFCPYSPETVFNLSIMLASIGRVDDALKVAKTCLAFDTENAGVHSLVDQITLHQQGGGRSPSAAAGAPIGSNLSSAVQTAAALLQGGRSNEAIEVLDRTLTNISDFNALMKLSEIYQSIGRLDRSKKTMQRAIDISPTIPEGWFNLALVEIAEGTGMASARSNLDQALRLSDERLKTTPAAANLRKVWDEDSRYKQVRELLK